MGVEITDLKIKVAAETAAAQKAIADLSDETLGLARAADTSGDAVKRAGAATAAATAQQNAAREAAQRAAKALNEHAAITQAFGKNSAETAASLTRLEAALAAAETAAREAERAIEGAAQAVKATAENADAKAVPALRRMRTQLETAGKSAESTASDLRALEARIEGVGSKAKGMGAAMASFVGNLGANAVSSLAGRLGDLGLHALDTAANFERMKTALTTTLGGTEAANKAFAQLQAFAAATPYSLEEVTDGFLKLKARGLDAGEKALTSYGNTASAMGKTLDDMVEAVADAVNGEGERLKEFGVGLKVNGDKAAITFRGVTKEITRDAKSIEAELIRLGEANFAGGMEAQSRTLGGMWSTMKDGFDQFIVTIMNSGIADALKSLMSSFSGMGETGKLLADILGVGLGGAFTILSGTVKIATTAVEAFSTAVNFVLTPVHMLKDVAADAASSFKDFSEFEALAAAQAQKDAEAQAQLVAEYRNKVETSDSLVGHMQRLIDLSGEYASTVAAEGVAHLAAANAAERRMAAESAMWDKLAKKQAAAEDAAAFAAFEKANEMGPALPPGFHNKKKGKKKAEKDLSGQGLQRASIMAGEERRAREAAFAAEVAAYEQESAIRDKRVAGIDKEIEAINARGVAEADHIDFVFGTLEIESEAARVREALIDQRLDKELEVARWEAQNAKTAEQRERALTRVEAGEHAKRIRTMEQAAAAEAKTARQREQVFGTLASAHNVLAESMIDAAFRAAEGEKIAVGQMLQELLKGIARKHSLLALAEAALAVGAFASYRYASGAAHLSAAGLHTGVAALAGVGAYAVGKVVDIPQGGAKGGGGGGKSGGSTGSTGGGGSRGGGDDGDLEAQEVPVSHEQLRRGDGRVARSAGPAIIVNFNAPIVGAGGMREVVATIRREIDRDNRGGARPRN